MIDFNFDNPATLKYISLLHNMVKVLDQNSGSDYRKNTEIKTLTKIGLPAKNSPIDQSKKSAVPTRVSHNSSLNLSG